MQVTRITLEFTTVLEPSQIDSIKLCAAEEAALAEARVLVAVEAVEIEEVPDVQAED